MSTTGTSSFALTAPDLLLEAFERLIVKPSEITADHMFSARRSMNLLQSQWANRGVNLWKVDPAQFPTTIPLVPGTATYTLDSSVIMVLDVWLRTFPMGATVNLTPGLSTQGSGGFILTESGQEILTESGLPLETEQAASGSSSTVTVIWPLHGQVVGDYVNFGVPVSVGGLTISGFYKVQTVIDANNFTITASKPASTGVTNGGSTPQFTTTTDSQIVTVVFPMHGLASGDSFNFPTATSVGGLSIFGSYTVSVVDTNTFTITSPVPALSDDTQSENGGLMMIQGQTGSDPIDRTITPISRSEFSALPDKTVQGTVTQYYFDRQSTPTITFWEVPTGGPYEVRCYTVRQLQDMNVLFSTNPDIPYRFSEALCADLAYHLSKKFPPKKDSGITRADLREEAREAWMEAMSEDSERVSTYIVPDLSGYFQ